MPKVIVSGNLNQYGNAGQFETDRSTWGFADGDGITAVRSSAQQTAGLYSALVTKTSTNQLILYGRWTTEFGKKYICKAKVRVPTATPVAGDAVNITLGEDAFNPLVSHTEIDKVDKTVLEAKDTWVDVEASFEHTNTLFPSYNELISLHLDGAAINSGQAFVDQFEIYEYIDDDTPPPVCDLDIDDAGTTVTNETSEAAGDGSIEVDVDGSGTYEYSKDDGGAYQGSNLFSGLTTDIFIIKVRDTGISGCEDRWPFAVNHAAVTHDFTTVLTHESISGANDGAISFNVTGTGGPFEFSIDAGETWQAGNNFPGLAPGTYFVAVRNAAGNSVVKVVTINAGTIEIDKVYHSKNPVTLQKNASVGWELLTNYRLYNDVRVEDVADSGTFNSKLKVDLPPDTTGKVIFYLREAFRDAFTLTPPTLSQSTIVRLTDRIKRFKNFSGELQDTEVTPGALTESLPSLVLYGGIDKFHWPDLNYFTTYLQTNKKFLTWAPVKKYVDRNQEDYLNFFVYGNFSSLKLQIKAYFDDATNETSVTKTKTGTAFSQLYQVPAGPVNSGATLVNPAKNLVQYELTLLDQSDAVISETRTYYLSAIKHPLTRFIMFVNSLGSHEVLRFTGQAVQRSSIGKQIAQKFLQHNYAAIDGEFEVNTATLMKRTNFSSGHITGELADEWHEYMLDLLMSPRVWDVTDGRRIPVMVAEAQHEDQDQNYVRYVRFDAQHAYDDESFTPRAI